MHYILIPILSLAFFLNPENSGQVVSSEKGEKEIVADKPGFPAHRMENLRVNHYFNLNGFSQCPGEVQKFYNDRNYKLAWFKNGRLGNIANDLINELKNSSQEGFPENYYELLPVSKAFTEMKNNPGLMKFFPYKIVELDILLTQTYLKFASELSTGLIKPNKLEIVWEVHSLEQNLVDVLKEAIEKNAIAESLQKLKPDNPQYHSLIAAREKLEKQKLNGRWPLPGQISKLEESDSNENVIRIKKYLSATGDLTYNDSIYLNSPVFDNRLTEAVKIFQGRHGLKQDGIAGKNTLREMNQPIDYRLDQIKINLDRLRWENQRSHQRYIAINIPDYSLKYFENGKITQQMNVVVGENENYTPALKDTISFIVINPTWNVPWSIATKEMLPKIKADSGFLAGNNYSLRRGSYDGKKVATPHAIDWSEITENNFPFFIVQEPGNFNSLGRIKFMLPNKHSIYLHDTPATHLFNQAQRDFSHGCIRLEKPFELAHKLLEGQMPPEEIREKLISRETEIILLEKKVPVHIYYHTAWIDSSGQMQFRNDVYEFDKISLAAFKK